LDEEETSDEEDEDEEDEDEDDEEAKTGHPPTKGGEHGLGQI